MKCPILLKAEVQEIVSKLGLHKVRVNEHNFLRLAQDFGLIAKSKQKSLSDYSNKEVAE